jgi:hypothetical protein
VATFPDGSAVVTGDLGLGTVFGVGEPNETVLTSQGGAANAFLARYNANGTLAWARRIATTPDLSGPTLTGARVATLGDGGILVLGSFQGNGIFGEGEPNEVMLTATGDYDVFLSRYSGAGALQWVRKVGSEFEDFGRGLAAFPDGACVITGEFSGNVTFGEGEPGEVRFTNSNIDHDMFVAGYRADGSLAWARRGDSATGLNTERGKSATALPDGTAVVLGDYTAGYGFALSGVRAPSVPTSDEQEVAVARYDAEGRIRALDSVAGAYEELGTAVAGFPDMTFVTGGFIYIEGVFAPNTPDEMVITAAAGEFVLFLARYAVP